MPEPVEVRRIFATDADRVRALRLEALSDPVAGIAFLESIGDAEAQPPTFWLERTIAGALSDTAAQFIAEVGRSWVGSVTVLLPEPGSVDDFGRSHPAGHSLLVGVYVTPRSGGEACWPNWWVSHRPGRRRAVAPRCFDVHEDNARAQAAYERLGFALTGSSWDGPHGLELEMVRGDRD